MREKINVLSIPKFDNEKWDFMNEKEREEIVFSLLKKQFLFNKENVEVYKELYLKIEEKDLKTLGDCIKKIPKIKKQFLRNLKSPYDLVPKKIRENPGEIYLNRGTGGTTGKPTSIFFTKNDWLATVDVMVRALKEIKDFKKPIIAFNGYNQGHISGPIFDDAIRKLGGLAIPRNFGSNDEQALQQIVEHKCNLIIAPPISTHKGGSVENLLEVDSQTGTNYINGDNVDVIFCSSTELTKEIYDELKNLGIKYIYNYYGSTEILPTAISCQESPFDLHILPGHVALHVVNENQEQVKDKERGMVIASRIGSYDSSGDITPNMSTELINYIVGDEVLFTNKKCKCGRTTPRISKIKRILDVEDKLAGGCEVW